MPVSSYKSNVEYMCDLAKRVRDYRIAIRMSQKEFAEAVGVSTSIISKFEQGVNPNITLSTFLSILRVFAMESRFEQILPELPATASTLKKMNKILEKPKRVRRKDVR